MRGEVSTEVGGDICDVGAVGEGMGSDRVDFGELGEVGATGPSLRGRGNEGVGREDEAAG